MKKKIIGKKNKKEEDVSGSDSESDGEDEDSEEEEEEDSLDHILAKPPEEKEADNYMNAAESFFAMIDEIEKLKTENQSLRMHLKRCKKTIKELNKENETLTIENQRFDLLFAQGDESEMD